LIITRVMNKCPGQNLSSLDISKVAYDIACPSCGNKVEFWYDDRKRKCNSCGETIQPSLEALIKYNNCASACKMARQCLGDEGYLKLVLKEFRTKEQGEKELEELVRIIPLDEKEVADFLTKAIRKNLETGFLLDPETDLEPLIKKDPRLYKKITEYLRRYALRE
jgi:hypothetical protein